MPPDPWQRTILDDWLARDNSTGQWASITCGLAVPRQNGKNGVLEMRELSGVIGRNEHILHTAHLVKTAAKHFRRLKVFFGTKARDPLAKYPDLNALVKEIRAVNGQEAIYLLDQCLTCGQRRGWCSCADILRRWEDGGSIEIASRSHGSGRGFTVDVLVCDEAQEMDDEELEALMPATSAPPHGDPQWIYTGTPPSPEASGEVWVRIRDEAYGSEPERITWSEWAADWYANLNDPHTYYRHNPALGRRLHIATVNGERKRFSDEGFARERCGRWPKKAGKAVIDQTAWGQQLNPTPPAPNARPAAIAVDMSHDRVLAISGCWELGNDNYHVELLHIDTDDDLAAAAAWLKERAGKRIPVVIDDKSPAAALGPLLLRDRVKVHLTGPSQMGKAYDLWMADLKYKRLWHAGQAQLNDAVEGALSRKIGDAGALGWDRRDPEHNIAPLVSASLARLGVMYAKPKSSGSRGSRQHTTRRAA